MLDDAVASYRRALYHKPDYADAHSNMGNAFAERGKLEEAIASYQRALAARSRLRRRTSIWAMP